MKYCTAPFLSPAITPNGFMVCSQPGQKVYDDISFWNSDEVKHMRQQIMNGEIPDSCKNCNAVRDGVAVSDVAPTSVDVPINFEHLYLARTNKCDYACEMCSATISHSYDKIYNEGKVGLIENNFDLSPYLKDTKQVAISGGNPVLDKKTLQIIESLDTENVERFIFTSNGSVFPDAFLEALSKFNCEVGLLFSIDGPQEFNEQAREGAKQQRIYNTINKVLDYAVDHPNLVVCVEYTFTSKSVHHYIDLYDEMLFGIKREHHDSVYMVSNMCGYPAQLSVTNIGRSTYNKVVNEFVPYLQKHPTILADQFLKGLYRFIDSYQRTNII